MVPKPPADCEINPYESPAEAGGYDGRSHAGVGAWRDGEFLVVHAGAVLPPFCVKTGQPAERNIPYTLHRSFVLDRANRRLKLDVPISHAGSRLHASAWRKEALTAAGAGFVFLALLLVLSNGTGINIARYVAFLFAVTMAGGCVLHWSPLQFARARGPYFWLSGADVRFLEHLPIWIAGS